MSNTNEPIIKQLDIPAKTLQEINRIMESNMYSPYYKRKSTRELLGHTFCGGCQSIPEIEVSFVQSDIIKIEHWCLRCYKLSLEREKIEPTNREDLALFYGCTKAPEGTFGGPKRNE